MPFTALDHPAIACFDVEGQTAWYCRHLGMRVIAASETRPTAYMLGYGSSLAEGTALEMMAVRDEGPRPETFRRFQPGLRHLAIRVHNFDAAYAKLAKAQVRFITDVGQAVGGGRIVSFLDPEGNELQIVERDKPASRDRDWISP